MNTLFSLLVVAVVLLVGIILVSNIQSYTTKHTIVEELFDNQEDQTVALSPTLHNLLGTPVPTPVPTPVQGPTQDKDTNKDKDTDKNQTVKNPVNVDALAHAVACANSNTPTQKPSPPPKPLPPVPPTPSCPSCPVCPDMSQYIRMDEIPCWNCTLP